MGLGDRLRKEREKKGWTQAQAADKAGITSQALSNYEREYRDPDTATLSRLAQIYGVSVDYLLGHTDDRMIPSQDLPRNPDIRIISRAGDRLTPEQAEQLRKVAEALFPDAFKEK
ncbi:MAG: helix-turn-helix domain-containing protein [Betaproteobacteria bacterium]